MMMMMMRVYLRPITGNFWAILKQKKIFKRDKKNHVTNMISFRFDKICNKMYNDEKNFITRELIKNKIR